MRLLLLRHAKSDWSGGEASDHARPLAPRGREAARRMGAYIAQQGYCPALILSSDSRRTRETVELLLPALPSAPKVLRLVSPFDYENNAKAFVVTDVNKEDPRQVSAAMRELFLAAGGGGQIGRAHV